MKTVFLFAAVIAAAPLSHAAKQTPAPTSAENTEVVFVAPEKFSDARDSYTGTDSGREAILSELRTYLQKDAKRLIPSGDRLFVSVTDVDLAGDFEPWRGGQWDDVRIVKDIYPPRIDLSFRLVNSAGVVVKEGTRNLRDNTFLMYVAAQLRDDPLRHEKALIDDWLRSEFRAPNKH